ncbi:MAG: hypothetical protein ACE5GU_11815 [Candidatus Scalinduaceae bacterium]
MRRISVLVLILVFILPHGISRGNPAALLRLPSSIAKSLELPSIALRAFRNNLEINGASKTTITCIHCMAINFDEGKNSIDPALLLRDASNPKDAEIIDKCLQAQPVFIEGFKMMGLDMSDVVTVKKAMPQVGNMELPYDPPLRNIAPDSWKTEWNRQKEKWITLDESIIERISGCINASLNIVKDIGNRDDTAKRLKSKYSKKISQVFCEALNKTSDPDFHYEFTSRDIQDFRTLGHYPPVLDLGINNSIRTERKRKIYNFFSTEREKLVYDVLDHALTTSPEYVSLGPEINQEGKLMYIFTCFGQYITKQVIVKINNVYDLVKCILGII